MLRLRQVYHFSIDNYVLASRIGGASHDNLYDLYKGKYMNLALSNLKVSNKLRGTTIVMNQKDAKSTLQILMTRCKNKIVACDTETIDLDVKKEVPVGRGKVICLSIFAGPEMDFGNGPRLFIDNFGLNSGLIDIYKPFFQSQEHLKVWHNYSFDRHVIYNHGIDVQGVGGDTMHMARLFDSSKAPKDYSLARLTEAYKVKIFERKDIIIESIYKRLCDQLKSSTDQQQKTRIKVELNCLEDYKSYSSKRSLKKVKIQDLFKRKKTLMDGKEGKVYQFPSILTLHTSPSYIQQWVQYSALDSQSTYYLREFLEYILSIQRSSEYPGIENMWELYKKYWRPFAQVLTDMERQGMEINLQHIDKIKQKAHDDLKKKEIQFINFVKTFQDDPNIHLFNPSSTRQMQQLLHAPYVVGRKPEVEVNSEEELEALENGEDEEVKTINRKIITQLPYIDQITVKNDDPSIGNKSMKIKVVGLGIPHDKLTPSKLPSVDAASLRVLAGNPKEKQYGKAYEYFKTQQNQEFGIQLCESLDSLCEYRNIQTLLGTFIEPLEGYVDQKHRVHCSLNINTETGRLSARKPNLQNQPALQKDIYRIRQAFQASKGKKFIVADYGQLELRILAHMTNCKAMIDAFEKGGDFHSRTAIGMYPKIRREIQQGKVILEWDKSKGQPPVPLLKDKYASERKKAKIVNFSIAYGKTAHGFAQDWNCSLEEAKQSLDLWYSERPEVKEWQDKKKQIAKTKHFTQTFLGRFRYLFKYFNVPDKERKSAQSMAMRRAINTPIQGGAADIVIAAMVNIHQNEELRKMGWKLLLQVHDELILEGPQQSAERALEIVRQKMSNPFQQKLRVTLQIDAKIGNNWYQCK